MLTNKLNHTTKQMANNASLFNGQQGLTVDRKVNATFLVDIWFFNLLFHCPTANFRPLQREQPPQPMLITGLFFKF